MRPTDCIKWHSCSAPLCPFDADWRKRRHLPGERVCLWLRELVKPDGMATLERALGEQAAATVAEVAPCMMARSSDIRSKLEAASRAGSKLIALASLHGRQP